MLYRWKYCVYFKSNFYFNLKSSLYMFYHTVDYANVDLKQIIWLNLLVKDLHMQMQHEFFF